MQVKGNDITIEIGASSETAAKNIERVSSALKGLRDSSKGKFSNLSKIASELSEVARVSREMEDSVDALAKTAQALERLSNLKSISIPKSIGDSIRNIWLASESLSPGAVETVDSLTKFLQRLSNVDFSTLSELKGIRLPNIPESAGAAIREMVEAINQITPESMARIGELADHLSKLNNVDLSGLSLVLRNVNSQNTRVRVDSSDVDKASKRVSALSKTLSALKRIAFYRIIRSAIKSITDAFQEGLKNAYAFSQGIITEGHRFSTALDAMSTSSLMMKNQLGSAFISLLAAIAPIVNQIIGLVVRLADALSQFFAAFTGGTYLKAVNFPQKWADGAGGAAKAAKEWKNQLLGFDEINRLEEPSDPSGGGGGGSALDPSQMFEDTPIAEWIMRLKEKIQPIIDDIKMILDGLGKFVRGVFLEDWQLMAEGIAQVIEGLSSLVRHTVGLIGELVDNLLSGIQNIGNSFFTWLEEKTGLDLSWLRGIWNDAMWDLRKYVSEMFSDVQGVLQGLTDFLVGVFTGDWSRAWSGVKLIFINVWNALVGTVEYAINQMIFAINPLLGAINQISAFFGGPQIGGISLPRLNASRAGTTVGESGMSHSSGRFANGGYPESGQLFFAREDGAGAELVGTVGGRTAVASNDDIMNGIRQGVYEAVSAAMSRASTGEPVVRVYLDSREIKNGQNRLNRALGVG